MKCRQCETEINLKNCDNVIMNEVVVDRIEKIDFIIRCPECDAEYFTFISIDELDIQEY